MRILIIALVAVGFVSCADTNNPEHAFKTKSLRCNLEHIQYRRGYLKVLTNAYFNENPQKYGEVCAVAMTLDSLASEFNTYADCQLETALPVESQPLHGRWIFRTKLPPRKSTGICYSGAYSPLEKPEYRF